MADWKIAKSTESCAGCRREFAPAEPFFSGLKEAAPDEWQRQDYCAGCWPGVAGEYFSFWQTRRPERPDEIKFVQKASLDECFQDLWSSGEGQRRPRLLYLLALLLVRRKVLRLEGVARREGGEWLKLFRPAGGERYEVADPRLGPTAVDSLVEEVGQLFAAGLPAGEPAP